MTAMTDDHEPTWAVPLVFIGGFVVGMMIAGASAQDLQNEVAQLEGELEMRRRVMELLLQRQRARQLAPRQTPGTPQR